jgi:hypothetical protein
MCVTDLDQALEITEHDEHEQAPGVAWGQAGKYAGVAWGRLGHRADPVRDDLGEAPAKAPAKAPAEQDSAEAVQAR